MFVAVLHYSGLDSTMYQRETYILRLLRVQHQQEQRSSFSLRNIKSDEVQTFSSPEELIAYLSATTQLPIGSCQNDEE